MVTLSKEPATDPAAGQPPGVDAERVALQQTLRHGLSPFAPVSKPGRLEKVFLWACQILILAMIAIIASELVTRDLLGFSLQISDEFGGYLLAALAFCSFPVCQSYGYFHRVDFILARLPEVGQVLTMVIFDLLSLMFSAILLWQTYLLTEGSWKIQELATTIMMTPLWIPQLALPVGAAALCLSMTRSVVTNARWLAGAITRLGGSHVS